VEHAVNPNTKAIILAHPLGNMFDVDHIRDIADEYGIFLIEDGCDSLGGDFRGKKSGVTGDLSTISFYPAHHLSAGEGGAVLTNSPMMKKVVESLRDWGRDCWCEPGCDNTCGKRFGYKLGGLPEGFDHKYTYSRIGYNLKITDLQASILCSQLTRLDDFVAKRRYNWQRLKEGLEKFSRWLIMPEPTPGANPSWFGFHMTVKDVAPFKRHDIVTFLESRKVGTRLFFGGNLLAQPAYRNIHHKVYSELHNTNILMRGCFWIGVHPAINDAKLDYMIDTISEFMEPYA
jgi:CDP-6-deoxy-D-xylo-4-hexulose-3-dehydrase